MTLATSKTVKDSIPKVLFEPRQKANPTPDLYPGSALCQDETEMFASERERGQILRRVG